MRADEIRERTEAILDGPGFRSAWHEDGHPWAALVEFFRDLSEWSAANPDQSKGVLVLLVLLLIGLLAHMGWLIARELAPLPAPDLDEAVARALEGQASSWSEGWALIRAALAEADRYTAVFVAHRLFLARLDHQGCLEWARHKTNAMYLEELGDDPQRPRLLGWNALYEAAVYAHRPVDPAVLEQKLAELEAG